MSTLSLRLPDSLHRAVRQMAEADQISINQFIASAVAEKASALMTEEYLRERAAKGSRAKYNALMARIPAGKPLPGDELP